MPPVQKRTISLPLEHTDYIDSLVSTGGYASTSEVVRAGLRALQERDSIVETWLHENVVPVVDAMHADPKRAIKAETVFSNLRARHDRRIAIES